MKDNETAKLKRDSRQVPVKILIEPVYIGLIAGEELFMEVLYQDIMKKIA